MSERAELWFYGAIDNEVTWSKFIYQTIINNKPYKIAIDMWDTYSPWDKALNIPHPDTILITHGHQDHCWNLPRICKQWFSWYIYCSHLTSHIIPTQLQDALHLEESNTRSTINFLIRQVKKKLKDAWSYTKNYDPWSRLEPNELALREMWDRNSIRNLNIAYYKDPVRLYWEYKEYLAKYKVTDIRQIKDVKISTDLSTYTRKDVNKVRKLLKPSSLNKEFVIKQWVDNTISIILLEAWHIMWSTQILIKDKVFGNTWWTWDVWRLNQPQYLNPPQLYDKKFGTIHRLIMETTYGWKNHPDRDKEQKIMMEKIKNINWNIIIGAFSLWRLQDVIQKIIEYKSYFQDKKIILDGYSAKQFTQLFQHYHQYKEIKQNQDLFTRATKDRTALSKIIKSNNNIIITPSGMINGGSISKYLPSILLDKKALLVLVGYQAKGSGGYRILNRKYKVWPNKEPIKCEVFQSNGRSSHADQKELLQLAKSINPELIYLVHGQKDAKQTFKKTLIKQWWFSNFNIIIPSSRANKYPLISPYS